MPSTRPVCPRVPRSTARAQHEMSRRENEEPRGRPVSPQARSRSQGHPEKRRREREGSTRIEDNQMPFVSVTKMPHERGKGSKSQEREGDVRPVRVTQARAGLRRDQSQPSMGQNALGMLGLTLITPAQQLVTSNVKCDEFTGAQREYEKWKKVWKRFIGIL